MRNYQKAFLLFCCFWVNAHSEPVQIIQDQSTGNGYTFRKGDVCYVVTASHVVPKDMAFYVRDTNKHRVSALPIRRFDINAAGERIPGLSTLDIVIGAVDIGVNIACSETFDTFSIQAELLRTAIISGNPVVSLHVGENELKQQRLTIRKSQDNLLTLQPSQATDIFRPGDSGSFLTIPSISGRSQLLGMITQVKPSSLSMNTEVYAIPLDWMYSLIAQILSVDIRSQSLRYNIGSAYFEHTSSDEWIEMKRSDKGDSLLATYRERSRDERYIYIIDASRNCRDDLNIENYIKGMLVRIPTSGGVASWGCSTQPKDWFPLGVSTVEVIGRRAVLSGSELFSFPGIYKYVDGPENISVEELGNGEYRLTSNHEGTSDSGHDWIAVGFIRDNQIMGVFRFSESDRKYYGLRGYFEADIRLSTQLCFTITMVERKASFSFSDKFNGARFCKISNAAFRDTIRR